MDRFAIRDAQHVVCRRQRGLESVFPGLAVVVAIVGEERHSQRKRRRVASHRVEQLDQMFV